MAQRDISRWWRSHKQSLACLCCGEDHPSVLEFHHRDPETKEFNVARKIRSAQTWEDLQEIRQEMAKCDILCSNCHKKVHFKWREMAKMR